MLIGWRGNLELIDNLDQAFSALTHELGNSVNSLNVTLEVLLRNNHRFEEQKKIEFLERALEQTARQRRFLDAIKSYYKDAAGETELVPFAAFWPDLTDALAARIGNGGIRFTHDAPAHTFHLIVNRESLIRAMVRVLENAVDAVAGSDGPQIDLSVRNPAACRGYAALIVRDNGGGIDEDHLPNVFTPLFTTKPGRAGLGLSVARKIVTRMGGVIEAGNRPDGGAEVRILVRSVDKPGE